MITHEAVEAILGPVCSPEEAARRVAWAQTAHARMSGATACDSFCHAVIGRMIRAHNALEAERDTLIARVAELEVERDVQQGYQECMTDAAELLAAEVRRLRAMVLRMHAARVETNVFAGGWRAASLLRHYADGIESGRLP